MHSRLIGRCLGTLAVMKLMAEVRSHSDSRVQIGNDVMACLSTILSTDRDDMKYCLEWPDAVELATFISLVFGEFGPHDIWGNTGLLEDIINGTYAVLCETPSIKDAVGWRPFTWFDIFHGDLARFVVSRLHNLFQVDISDTSGLTVNVRRSCLRMCMRSLWYCAKAYHQPPVSETTLLYLLPKIAALASPEIIHLIHVEQDPVSRATGRCFGALIVARLGWLAANVSKSDFKISYDELTCLSTILGTTIIDVKFCLERPGVIELAIMVSIALGDVGSLDVDALPPGMRDVAQQTLTILSQKAKLKLDQPIAQLNFLDGESDHIIVSGFHDLLQECISGTSQASPLTDEVCRGCLRMCLNCLWYCAKAYYQPGIFKPLPSYFFSTLASPELIRLIHVEQDRISRVTGRCFGALVAMKLAVDIRSRADLNIQISDDKLACLSAILGAERLDLKIWLGQPCAIELATILSLISSEIDFLFSDTIPLEVLDMVQQTYSILTRTLPDDLNAKQTDG